MGPQHLVALVLEVGGQAAVGGDRRDAVSPAASTNARLGVIRWSATGSSCGSLTIDPPDAAPGQRTRATCVQGPVAEPGPASGWTRSTSASVAVPCVELVVGVLLQPRRRQGREVRRARTASHDRPLGGHLSEVVQDLGGPLVGTGGQRAQGPRRGRQGAGSAASRFDGPEQRLRPSKLVAGCVRLGQGQVEREDQGHAQLGAGVVVGQVHEVGGEAVDHVARTARPAGPPAPGGRRPPARATPAGVAGRLGSWTGTRTVTTPEASGRRDETGNVRVVRLDVFDLLSRVMPNSERLATAG